MGGWVGGWVGRTQSTSIAAGSISHTDRWASHSDIRALAQGEWVGGWVGGWVDGWVERTQSTSIAAGSISHRPVGKPHRHSGLAQSKQSQAQPSGQDWGKPLWVGG